MYHTIFVFGSNLSGIHGAGAAYAALKHHGARMGQGVGKQGNSYAIPTKDYEIKTLPLSYIELAVQGFIKYANDNPNERFYVTRIGCGLAGYKDHDIAPFFRNAPKNCILHESWRRIINELGVHYDSETV